MLVQPRLLLFLPRIRFCLRCTQIPRFPNFIIPARTYSPTMTVNHGSKLKMGLNGKFGPFHRNRAFRKFEFREFMFFSLSTPVPRIPNFTSKTFLLASKDPNGENVLKEMKIVTPEWTLLYTLYCSFTLALTVPTPGHKILSSR